MQGERCILLLYHHIMHVCQRSKATRMNGWFSEWEFWAEWPLLCWGLGFSKFQIKQIAAQSPSLISHNYVPSCFPVLTHVCFDTYSNMLYPCVMLPGSALTNARDTNYDCWLAVSNVHLHPSSFTRTLH